MKITKDYKIDSRNLPGFRKKIDAINRRSVRYNFAPVGYEVGDSLIEIVEDEDGFRHEVCLYAVTVTADLAPLGDWTVIGSVRVVDDAVFISGANAGDIRPYRKTPERCEHCNLKRSRKATFILEGSDGERKQVGSTCLQDYTGDANAHKAAKWAEVVWSLSESLEDDESYALGSGRIKREADYVGTFEEVLTFAAASVREQRGYFNLDRARTAWEFDNRNVDTTRNHTLSLLEFNEKTYLPAIKKIANRRWAIVDVWNNVNAVKPETFDALKESVNEWNEEINRLAANVSTFAPVRDEDRELAAKVLEWVEGIDPETENDYEYNLTVVSNLSLIPRNLVGLAVSAVGAYLSRVRRAEWEEKKAHSEHIGEVGKRESWEVTIDRVSGPFDTAYGELYVHNYVTEDGNVLVWKTGCAPDDTPKGTKVILTGTVKAHGEYKGLKQTVVNRCKFKAVEVA